LKYKITLILVYLIIFAKVVKSPRTEDVLFYSNDNFGLCIIERMIFAHDHSLFCFDPLAKP